WERNLPSRHRRTVREDSFFMQPERQARTYPELAGKWALVTGSSRGFGKAIALRLAAEGVNIVVNYRRSRSEAEETAAEIRAQGVSAGVIQANVGAAEDVARLFAAIEQHCDRPAILVSNAAFGKLGPIMEATDKHWNATFDV